MITPRFIPLVLRQVVRNRTRSFLTVSGTALAMFLFSVVQAMQGGVQQATELTARDTTLVVYRENRFCPFTSRLPEFYMEQIRRIPHVRDVLPMKVVVNNCRTSLDVVTFRGVPARQFMEGYGQKLKFLSGSRDEWLRRSDGALLGHVLASRRGLKVGDRFVAAGITVYVAGIVTSTETQDVNSGYVHLSFLQQSVDQRLGVVTQFQVRVDDPALLGEVAAQIDQEFRTSQEPTATSAEKAFVARAIRDVVVIVSFTRWLGYGCILAVFALVGNSIVLSVQERVKEHAVLQTLGFGQGLIARLIMVEGVLLSAGGGCIGSVAGMILLSWGNFTMTSEGLSIRFAADPVGWVFGLVISSLLGVLAGLVPAWQASRREIAPSFRAV